MPDKTPSIFEKEPQDSRGRTLVYNHKGLPIVLGDDGRELGIHYSNPYAAFVGQWPHYQELPFHETLKVVNEHFRGASLESRDEDGNKCFIMHTELTPAELVKYLSEAPHLFAFQFYKDKTGNQVPLKDIVITDAMRMPETE